MTLRSGVTIVGIAELVIAYSISIWFDFNYKNNFDIAFSAEKQYFIFFMFTRVLDS